MGTAWDRGCTKLDYAGKFIGRVVGRPRSTGGGYMMQLIGVVRWRAFLG